MVTIYCTTPSWNHGNGDIMDFTGYDEVMLLKYLQANDTRLIKVAPHGNSCFRDKFIAPHLNKEGYLTKEIEGVYFAHFLSCKIQYRIIIDYNQIINNQ